MSRVSVVRCASYSLAQVRESVMAVLEPLGGMPHFVHPGARVLLKPNLATDASPGQAITTHPAVVQVVAELVQTAGGIVFLGDGPAGPEENSPLV
ncbi:MAG: DUF362 domain-containing protein [Anaerolineae bacterium]|nr:DUF362 domain-containing protein [Anaerolineae bacterium]